MAYPPISQGCLGSLALIMAVVRGSAATRKTERGRAAQVASWIEYEYQTQRLLYAHGANVPRPFAQIGNAVLMEYIGAVGDPAPRLNDVMLAQEEAQPLFECILRNVELALSHGRIHADLSAYNVLYWQGTVTLIDFAQAVDPYHNSDVFSLFARDIERTCQYFARYGVKYWQVRSISRANSENTSELW